MKFILLLVSMSVYSLSLTSQIWLNTFDTKIKATIQSATNSSVKHASQNSNAFYNFTFPYQMKTIYGNELYHEFKSRKNSFTKENRKFIHSKIDKGLTELGAENLYVDFDTTLMTFYYRDEKYLDRFIEVYLPKSKEEPIELIILQESNDLIENVYNFYNLESKNAIKGNNLCITKCLFDCRTADNFVNLPIYNGLEEDPIGVEEIEFTLSPRLATWERRKVYQDCLSDDIYDCLVWCLVEVPEMLDTFFIVTDTFNNKKFEINKISYKTLEQRAGASPEVVICGGVLGEQFFFDLSSTLKALGYNVNVEKNLTSELKAGLIKFQKDNNLPIGNLNLKTLKALDLDY